MEKAQVPTPVPNGCSMTQTPGALLTLCGPLGVGLLWELLCPHYVSWGLGDQHHAGRRAV